MTETTPKLPDDGPTELVEGRDGELEERLSGGTATLLLVWLIGVGAASSLLAAWLFSALFLASRLGAEHLFSDLGLYVALFGATGPTVLWLAGRAQAHSLGWFVVTAAKIGAVMIGIIIGGAALVVTGMGVGFKAQALTGALALVAITAVLSVLWALATWGADRYIARARIVSEEDQTS